MIFLGAHEIVANNNEDLSWSPCHHSRSRGMSDSASKTAKDEISAEAQRRADDAALEVNAVSYTHLTLPTKRIV